MHKSTCVRTVKTSKQYTVYHSAAKFLNLIGWKALIDICYIITLLKDITFATPGIYTTPDFPSI